MNTPSGEDGQQQDRYDICDFDHWVYRWTGRILVRIADRVAGHCRVVGIGPLASMVAVFYVLFGVIPRAPSGGH